MDQVYNHKIDFAILKYPIYRSLAHITVHHLQLMAVIRWWESSSADPLKRIVLCCAVVAIITGMALLLIRAINANWDDTGAPLADSLCICNRTTGPLVPPTKWPLPPRMDNMNITVNPGEVVALLLYDNKNDYAYLINNIAWWLNIIIKYKNNPSGILANHTMRFESIELANEPMRSGIFNKYDVARLPVIYLVTNTAHYAYMSVTTVDELRDYIANYIYSPAYL